MYIKEYNIPVPWGHIAVKAWGNEDDVPVLVFHGRQDNAGSFDKLIPLLRDTFYYICVDLPSHGKSSHFPPYLPIHFIHFLIAFKLIVQYFQRKSYIFLGHSYGGIVSQFFARMYPQYVEKLITIETIMLGPLPVKDMKKVLIKDFQSHIDLHAKLMTRQRPTYSYDEALKRIRSSRLTEPLTVEQAVSLLRRAVEPIGNGQYIFNVDQRMKMHMNFVHDLRYWKESIEEDPVLCPSLMILAKHTAPLILSFYPGLETIKKWKIIPLYLLMAAMTYTLPILKGWLLTSMNSYRFNTAKFDDLVG